MTTSNTNVPNVTSATEVTEAPNAPNAMRAHDEGATLPLIEEQLRVGKRSVDTGRGVRVHKRIDEKPVAIDEHLLHEDLDIRHVSVERVVGLDEAPGIRYENDGATLVVPVLEEVLVLERRVRIKEELHITRVKRQVRHAETVVLKSEQVHVEWFDEGDPPQSHFHHHGGNIMQHTLIAVFDNRSDAQLAQDELLVSGFSSSEVQLSEESASDSASIGGATKSGSSEPKTITGGIKNFFSDIFGSDSNDHAQKYSTAVSYGNHVLTVTASSEEEVERAADLIERFGPVDIDEKSAEWGGTATGSAGAMRMGSSTGSLQGASSMSQQSDDPTLHQQQTLQDPVPQGGTYQAPLRGAGTAGVSASELGSDIGESQRGKNLQDASLQGSQQRDTTTSAIPLVEEKLKVGKREVQRGGVRVYTRIVETPVNETIGLREEHVHVERRPVNQPIGTGDSTAFKEQSIELRETAEEAVIEKSARVVEEVVIGKDVRQRQEQISETVRHTEVEIEQLGAGSVDDDTYYRSHFDSNYASSGGAYDDYMPAYSYGSSMANDAKYHGRAWDDVESDMQSGWETRTRGTAGGVSTWTKMKAAVRHGWDRMTSLCGAKTSSLVGGRTRCRPTDGDDKPPNRWPLLRNRQCDLRRFIQIVPLAQVAHKALQPTEPHRLTELAHHQHRWHTNRAIHMAQLKKLRHTAPSIHRTAPSDHVRPLRPPRQYSAIPFRAHAA